MEDVEEQYKDDGQPIHKSFINSRNQKLVYYIWETRQENEEKKNRIILLVHGYAVHARFEWLYHSDAKSKPTYEKSWIKSLNDYGYTVCAIDLVSHGKSDPSELKVPCSIKHYDDFALDICEWRKVVANLYEDARFYLMGISLGGWTTLRALQLHNKQRNSKEEIFCEGLIALAPMLSLEKLKAKPLNNILLRLMNIINIFCPNLAVGSKQCNEKFPHIDDIMQADPICYSGRIRSGFAAQMLKAVEVIHEDISYLDENTKILVVHSTDDTMCEYEGSLRFHDKVGKHSTTLSTENQDKLFIRTSQDNFLDIHESTNSISTLWTIKKLWHAFTKEPDNELLLQELSYFLKVVS